MARRFALLCSVSTSLRNKLLIELFLRAILIIIDTGVRQCRKGQVRRRKKLWNSSCVSAILITKSIFIHYTLEAPKALTLQGFAVIRFELKSKAEMDFFELRSWEEMRWDEFRFYEIAEANRIEEIEFCKVQWSVGSVHETSKPENFLKDFDFSINLAFYRDPQSLAELIHKSFKSCIKQQHLTSTAFYSESSKSSCSPDINSMFSSH